MEERFFEAVIFDVDQTLVWSLDALTQVWVKFNQRFGITDYQELFDSAHGLTTRQIARLFLNHGSLLEDDYLDEAFKLAEHLEETETLNLRALPGAARALAKLPADRVAVGTSGTRAVATFRLQYCSLPIPPVMVTSQDVKHGKPAPDIFLLACEKLGFAPDTVLVVEDSSAGLAAAKVAGCSTLAVRVSAGEAELVADLVVDDLSKVDWEVTDQGIRVFQI